MSHPPLLPPASTTKQKNGKIFPLVEVTFRIVFVLGVDVWMVFVCFVSFCRVRVRVRVKVRERKTGALRLCFSVYGQRPFC